MGQTGPKRSNISHFSNLHPSQLPLKVLCSGCCEKYSSMESTLQEAYLYYMFFRRANDGGCKAIIWKPDRHDELGLHRPLANCFYERAKNRNGPHPLRLREMAELTIVCTCIGPHRPLKVLMAPRGEPDVIKGNERCWFNQIEYCRMGQDNDCTDRIFRYCFQRSMDAIEFCLALFFFWSPTGLCRHGISLCRHN